MEVSFAVTESYFALVLIAIFLICLVSAVLPGGYFRDAKGIPPGPIRLPILGHAGIIDYKAPHESFTFWAKKYGGIYRIYIGPHLLIIINDYEILKEAFLGKNAEIFSGKLLVIYSHSNAINNSPCNSAGRFCHF